LLLKQGHYQTCGEGIASASGIDGGDGRRLRTRHFTAVREQRGAA
jgi:hypothetical protein